MNQSNKLNQYKTRNETYITWMATLTQAKNKQ